MHTLVLMRIGWDSEALYRSAVRQATLVTSGHRLVTGGRWWSPLASTVV